MARRVTFPLTPTLSLREREPKGSVSLQKEALGSRETVDRIRTRPSCFEDLGDLASPMGAILGFDGFSPVLQHVTHLSFVAYVY
jgi:hypothetical protein